MLDTFKVRLKAKATAAGANLSQKRIDAFADRLHKKFPELKEEAEHDAEIDLLFSPDELKEFGSLDDYQRQKEARELLKKTKEEAERKKQQQQQQQDSPDDDDPEMPKWAKQLLESNKNLSATVNQLQSEKLQGSMKEQLAGNTLLSDVPGYFYKYRPLPQKVEDLENFATEIKTQWDAEVAESAAKGIQVLTTKPAVSNATTAKASQETINNIVDNIMK